MIYNDDLKLSKLNVRLCCNDKNFYKQSMCVCMCVFKTVLLYFVLLKYCFTLTPVIISNPLEGTISPLLS